MGSTGLLRVNDIHFLINNVLQESKVYKIDQSSLKRYKYNFLIDLVYPSSSNFLYTISKIERAARHLEASCIHAASEVGLHLKGCDVANLP